MDAILFSWLAFLMSLAMIVDCTLYHSENQDKETTYVACNTRLSLPRTGRHNCFEEKCKCAGDKADCSQNYGNLTFVPKLPDNIRFLIFSYNNLTSINRADFFQNVTNIEFLDLGDNGLRYIHPQVFVVLRRLRSLLLNYNNHLDYPDLQPVFTIPTLQRLDLIHGSLASPPPDLFHRFPMYHLQCISWNQNYLTFLNFSVLRPLVSLEKIKAGSNLISGVKSDFMPRLKKLFLPKNAMQTFPETCSPNGTSYFPSLTNLFLSENNLYALERNICLPKLKMLELSGNRFTSIYSGMFSTHRFPSLVEMYMESMNQHKLAIQNKAFNNTSLERISLMYNAIKFQDEIVAPESFADCPRLRNLVLSGNVFTGVDDKRFHQLFGDLKHLVALFLGHSFIAHVTPKTFANFKSLQRLYLYNNNLQTLPDGVFDENNLTLLDLHGNKLRAISPLTFGEPTKRRLQYLDLSENLLPCSCDLRWFRDWLVARPSLFANSRGHYTCSDRNNITMVSFYLPDQACLMSTDSYKLIIASVCILTFTLMMLSSLYRYRWHIRLVLYETFRDRSGDRRRRLQEQVYNYDVFVSYAAENLPWVQTRLMPELEQRLALRLCVHQRDFLPGKNIVDNIVDSVSDSKKILMVFSTNFARSHWCQFELAFCLRHVLEKDDDLIIVCLEDILSRDLTSVMMAVLKTNTYIQWRDHPDAAASFWGRLQIALQEILPDSA